jgi:hypothetical protein
MTAKETLPASEMERVMGMAGIEPPSREAF